MPLPRFEAELARPQAVDVDYVYTSTEAVRSSLAITRASAPKSRFIPWLGAGLVGLALYLLFTDSEAWRRAWFPGGFGAIFLMQPLWMRWTIRRNFRKTPGANATIRWRINDETLEAHGPFGDTTFQWSALLKVQATRHGYLLFTQPYVAQWLPRAAFSSPRAAGQFETWVIEKRATFGTGERRGGAASLPAATPASAMGVSSAAVASSPALVVTFTYTAAEAGRARLALQKSVPIWMRYAPWFPAVPAAAVVLVITTRQWDWRQIALVVVLLSVAFWLVQVRIRRARAKAFADSSEANRQVRWRIDAEQFEVVGAHTDASFRWTALLKVRETTDGFLLFQQPRLAQWLPTTAFADSADLDQFRTWIQQHAIDFRRVA
jgi:hypothetical protein